MTDHTNELARLRVVARRILDINDGTDIEDDVTDALANIIEDDAIELAKLVIELDSSMTFEQAARQIIGGDPENAADWERVARNIWEEGQ
jgi:hypothetical protein